MSQSKAQLTNPFGTVNITDGVNVSGVITATTLVGDGTALTGIALTGNINTSGIITASEFYGYGGDLDNVGLSTTGSINTTGIITASAFYGDGSGLTGIGGDLTVLTFSPISGATEVDPGTNIVLTFNRPIKRGTGTITLRTDSATGTIIESFDASTSPLLSINAGELTINPTSDLSITTNYYLVFPAGTITDEYYSPNSLIDTYNFTTATTVSYLFVWGSNSSGQLGQNNLTQYSSPTQIPGVQWSSISISQQAQNTLGTKTDGTLWVWGRNLEGQLGQNNRVNSSSPIQVPGTQWSEGYSGTYNTIGKKTDGTLWFWGSNTYGQVGQNNKTNYSSPVQVPGTNWNKISLTYRNIMATKTDGTLWMCGANSNGELGQNSRVFYSSPVQVPGTQWDTVGENFAYAMATKTDGTLWSWGYNGFGKLGINVSGVTSAYRSSPTQIPGTQWSEIGAGNNISMATKTDGTLWSWGANNVGQLGQNNKTYYSSPVQIPGTQWDKIVAGYAQAGATKTDGTLWAWGTNGAGTLGQNDILRRSSPTQIPGTQWSGKPAISLASAAIQT